MVRCPWNNAIRKEQAHSFGCLSHCHCLLGNFWMGRSCRVGMSHCWSERRSWVFSLSSRFDCCLCWSFACELLLEQSWLFPQQLHVSSQFFPSSAFAIWFCQWASEVVLRRQHPKNLLLRHLIPFSFPFCVCNSCWIPVSSQQLLQTINFYRSRALSYHLSVSPPIFFWSLYRSIPTLCVVFHPLVSQVNLILVFLFSDRKDLAERLLLEFLYVSVVRLALVKLNVGVHLSQCFSKGGIKIIFDVVVGSPRQFLGDRRPSVPYLFLHAK